MSESEEHPFKRANRMLCEKLGAGSCPFCGGPPRISGGGMHFWRISCDGCGSKGPMEVTDIEAAAAWNRRPEGGGE